MQIVSLQVYPSMNKLALLINGEIDYRVRLFDWKNFKRQFHNCLVKFQFELNLSYVNSPNQVFEYQPYNSNF